MYAARLTVDHRWLWSVEDMESWTEFGPWRLVLPQNMDRLHKFGILVAAFSILCILSQAADPVEE
ncbi:hypothetical protein BDV06DRAFT_194487 [Aspergillus oleicola]